MNTDKALQVIQVVLTVALLVVGVLYVRQLTKLEKLLQNNEQ